jgi:hypothetical protein
VVVALCRAAFVSGKEALAPKHLCHEVFSFSRMCFVRDVVAFAFVAQSFAASAKFCGFASVAKPGNYALGGLNGGEKYPAKSNIIIAEKLARAGLIAGNFALALNWNGGSGQFNP